MNSPALALRTASVIFGLMGLGHLIRIFVATTVCVGGCPIGRRWSVLAAVVLAGLCGWLWRVAATAARKSETVAPKPMT